MTNGTLPLATFSTTATSYEVSNTILGEGSNSIVRLGRNTKTGEKVALKIIDQSSLSIEEIRQLKKETRVLRKLNTGDSTSDDFVHLLDEINQDGYACLVTDLVEGGDLHDYCSSYAGGVPERIGKWIFHRVLKSVDNLHDKDLCHLDLKLENVMYNKQSRKTKLIDFGFASETAEYNDEGEKTVKLQSQYCGSVHYAPPEIVKRTPYNGKAADVWSLGILLFVLLSGLFPFNDPNHRVDVIFDQIVAGKFFMPRFLSTDAQDLLKSMLKQEPSKRPSVKSLLKHPWFSVVSQ